MRLEEYWYKGHPFATLLTPLSWLFRMLAALRRRAYRSGLLRSVRLPVPVIVVGNITVGGTGKTPLVVWLAELLRARGRRPGIVCRGYRGRAAEWPQTVTEHSDPHQVGDEAVLLARRTGCTVIAGPDRVAAARRAVGSGCDVIIADDGLQHYALARDIEIVVIDGARRFGNGRCLPAGPLREPVRRLASVDFVVANGAAQGGEYGMRLDSDEFRRLGDGRTATAEYFAGRDVHAVAGIGNPARFFRQLRTMGLTITEHPFPDHHAFTAEDVDFGAGAVVIMTEKDAVKWPSAEHGEYWYLPVNACLDRRFGGELLRRLDNLVHQT